MENQESDYSGFLHKRLRNQYTNFTLLATKRKSFLFRAKSIASESEFLIEVFNSATSDSNSLWKDIEVFIQKAFLQLKCKHENILKVIDCDLDMQEYKLFVVFPYYPNLKEVLADKSQTINVAKLFEDVSQALQYAHVNFQVAHGTLTTESIYYDQVKDAYMVSNLTFPHEILGQTAQNFESHFLDLRSLSKEYWVPELRLFSDLESLALNVRRIDVYLLGLVVLECLGIDRKYFLYLEKGLSDAMHYNLLLKGLLVEGCENFQNTAKTKDMLFKMLQKEPESRPNLILIDFSGEPGENLQLENISASSNRNYNCNLS